MAAMIDVIEEKFLYYQRSVRGIPPRYRNDFLANWCSLPIALNMICYSCAKRPTNAVVNIRIPSGASTSEVWVLDQNCKVHALSEMEHA